MGKQRMIAVLPDIVKLTGKLAEMLVVAQSENFTKLSGSHPIGHVLATQPATI